METNRTLIGSLCFVGAALAASLCLAQDGQTTSVQAAAARNQVNTTVISLTHANAHAVGEALEALELNVAVGVASDTMLILRGNEQVIRHFQAELIPQLDVPDGMGDELNTAFIPLGRVPGQGFIDLLRAAAPGRRTRIALDKTSRLLVVHATEGELKAIRRVVDAVSKPPASLTLSFYFIRGRIGADEGKQAALPKSLDAVGRTLLANGFSDLSLMSPVIISVEEGRAFEQQSLLRTDDGQGAADELYFHVQGRARLDGDGKIVQMEVEANVQGEYQTDYTDEHDAHFELHTTMVAKLGDYVVLAAAPSSSASGSAIAVVVTVTAN